MTKREQKIRSLLNAVGNRLHSAIEVVEIRRHPGSISLEFRVTGLYGSSAAFVFPFLNDLADEVSAAALEDMVMKSHINASQAPPISVNTVAKGMTASASGSR